MRARRVGVVCATLFGALTIAPLAQAADTTEPQTAIDTAPPAFSIDTTPSFTFSGTDPEPEASGIEGFECSLDGAPFASCKSGDEFSAPEGDHTFEVKAIDKAGNEDTTPASHAWMVDTTAPNVTIDEPLPKSRYLLHATVPLDFVCADPLSGGPPTIASGIASCAPNSIDNETLGPHKLTVTAEDKAGNSAASHVAYVIDPPRYGEFVLADHPVAFFRLNEPFPSSFTPQEIEMLDSSGNGHHGTYKNNVALGRSGAISCARRPHPPRACELASDPEDRAAFFPERDGYGYVNGISASPSGYTMEAWVQPRDAANMMVMSHGRAGQLYIENGKLAFEQSQDTVHGTGPAADVPPGEWSHVAATWDAASGETRLYVNGELVGFSGSTNKEPSGTSTFYVGYGEKAPWFHGEIDEAALYDRALDQHAFEDRYKIGTAKDNPSVEAGASPLNSEGPFTDPAAPKNGGLYAPTKTPDADFTCTDPDDAPGDSDIASCTATVDGSPIESGDPLPDTLGPHTFVVTAIDESGNTYIHHHTYTVKDFAGIIGHDLPIAYYRLGDGTGETMADASPHGRSGIYKNDQESGPIGISGDGDRARRFFGAGGYGYVNGIAAPNYQMTLEAWIDPDDAHRDQSIAGHGDGGELFVEGGELRFRHGAQNRIVSAGVGPNASGFTQVVGTWDGVDLRIYVDGVLKGTTESSRGPTSFSTFYVGFGEVEPWFAGAIDEVAYYGIALSPARVYQHYLADPPPGESTMSRAPSGSSSGNGGSQPQPQSQPVAPPPAGATYSGTGVTQGNAKPRRTLWLTRCSKRRGAHMARCMRRARGLARCHKRTGAQRRNCVKRVRRIGRRSALRARRR